MMTVHSNLGEGLDNEDLSQADFLLTRCREAFAPDRGLILVKTATGWVAAALHNLPTKDFWKPQNVSIAGIEAAVTQNSGQVMMDTPVDEKDRLMALMSGNFISFMAFPLADSSRVVYLSRQLSKGFYQEKDLKALETLLYRA